jgi:uncharacterized cofD-like protein
MPASASRIPSSRAASNPRIAVIGGGTGSFTVLSGLKHYAQQLTAVVNMSDDGGSSGILRDELGALPPGDVRQCLVALSESDQTMRDLFNYRFTEGTFAGHSFGNLLLSTLERTTGSFAKAVETASAILKITGQVVPATYDNIRLNLRLPDGRVIEGEDTIGENCAGQNFFRKGERPDLYLQPAPTLTAAARDAILAADLVVICPGKLYSSIGPTLLIKGTLEALRRTSARIIYVCNLMTLAGQTDDYNATDHADALEQLAGGPFIDYVLSNTAQPEPELLAKYGNAHGTPVHFDLADFAGKHYQGIGASLVAEDLRLPQAGDKLRRSFIRHDPDKIARLIMHIYTNSQKAD